MDGHERCSRWCQIPGSPRSIPSDDGMAIDTRGSKSSIPRCWPPSLFGKMDCVEGTLPPTLSERRRIFPRHVASGPKSCYRSCSSLACDTLSQVRDCHHQPGARQSVVSDSSSRRQDPAYGCNRDFAEPASLSRSGQVGSQATR